MQGDDRHQQRGPAALRYARRRSALHQRSARGSQRRRGCTPPEQQGQDQDRRIDRAGMDLEGRGDRDEADPDAGADQDRDGNAGDTVCCAGRFRTCEHLKTDHIGIQELQADDQHDGRRQECGGDEDGAVPRDCSGVAAAKRDRGAEDDERDDGYAQVTFGLVIRGGGRERIGDGDREDAGMKGEQQHEPGQVCAGERRGRIWPGCRCEGGVHHGAAIMPPATTPSSGRPRRPLQCSTNSVSVIAMSSPIRPVTSARTGLKSALALVLGGLLLLRPART